MAAWGRLLAMLLVITSCGAHICSSTGLEAGQSSSKVDDHQCAEEDESEGGDTSSLLQSHSLVHLRLAIDIDPDAQKPKLADPIEALGEQTERVISGARVRLSSLTSGSIAPSRKMFATKNLLYPLAMLNGLFIPMCLLKLVSGGKPRLAAEFQGTFVLVFTVICCSVAGNATWNALAIGSILTAIVYTLSPISGGHLNPAVSIAMGFAGAMEWPTVFKYCAVQFTGAAAATVCAGMILPLQGHVLGPVAPYGNLFACMAEALYSAFLCFVVLHCVASKTRSQIDVDQFFGIAIGFVVVAANSAIGGISGAILNPAVSFGLDFHRLQNGWALYYTASQLVGSYVAAVAYRRVRPEDDCALLSCEAPLRARCLSEFIGAFMLVVTVCLSVVTGSRDVALGAGACLMSLVYSLGDVSGAHFNPSVTAASVLRGFCRPADGFAYASSQSIAAVLAALVASIVHLSGPNKDRTFALRPGEGFSLAQAGVAECFFTFVLAYVVLSIEAAETSVSQIPGQKLLYSGLVVGSCVIAGGVAIGPVSGGELNPSVSIGLSTMAIASPGITDREALSEVFANLTISASSQFAGGFFAAIISQITHAGDSYWRKSLSRDFVGTFVIALTAAACVAARADATWHATAIASVMVAVTYAMGPISGGGAGVNPAIALSLGLVNNLPWLDVAKYICSQALAGIAAGAAIHAFGAQTSLLSLHPYAPFSGAHAAAVEIIFTAVLCFTFLHVAGSKASGGPVESNHSPNHCHGLAIGYVIIAASASGGICRVVLNPAAVLAMDIQTPWHANWGIVWILAEICGAALGVALFKATCREVAQGLHQISEFPQQQGQQSPSLPTRCTAEFAATFIVALTVNLNVISDSKATPWSAAAALVCLVYALGDVSGAHLNPAVTVANLLGGNGNCDVAVAVAYIISQVAGGLAAGAVGVAFGAAKGSDTAEVQPMFGTTWQCAATAELFFTFVLAYVFLAIASTSQQPQNSRRNFPIGLAIASCVTAGGVAIGSISGGYLNPAVTVSAAIRSKAVGFVMHYVAFQIMGGIMAAAAFRLTHPLLWPRKVTPPALS